MLLKFQLISACGQNAIKRSNKQRPVRLLMLIINVHDHIAHNHKHRRKDKSFLQLGKEDVRPIYRGVNEVSEKVG